MRAEEVRPCDLCGRPLCEAGHVSFHRVRFERFGVDVNAIRERAGLALLFQGRASPNLIETFATIRDVATPIHEGAELIVCETCASFRDFPIAMLAEIAHQAADKREAEKG